MNVISVRVTVGLENPIRDVVKSNIGRTISRLNTCFGRPSGKAGSSSGRGKEVRWPSSSMRHMWARPIPTATAARHPKIEL